VQWDEPFGLVFAEAMACGTPVVSWKRGSLPEIVEHGKTGFLVTSEDELVPAIAQVGSLSRKLCRRVVEDRFSSEVFFRAYESMCREVLS